ncbi:glycosyltransferase family 8 protein [Photobacterium damselae]|uniref:glycosyltransferase family 8 protein n=1 Tax=Photobacterium damselae TaxID=38293 RepID=UPI004068C92B
MKINLCFCIDDNYTKQVLTVIHSIMNTNENNKISIYILSSGVSEFSKNEIKTLISKNSNYGVFFIDVGNNKILELSAGGHISNATYIRFLIPELLIDIDKVLYLDADIIVNDNLIDFWNFDISNKYLAAVDNPCFNRYESLGINAEWGYFNAGVILINLVMWRNEKVKDKCISFLEKNKKTAIMFDQDALNYVVQGNWESVPIKWNLQTIFLRKRKLLKYKYNEIDDAIKKPGIIHYSSSSKPWHLLDAHPLRKEYLKYETVRNKVKRDYSKILKSVIKYIYVKTIFLYQRFN